MNLDKHTTIARLRSAIRSQESASRGLRAQINALRAEGPSTGPQRHDLHQRKQSLGSETRVLLLALAMVRGRPYASAEQRARNPVAVIYVAYAALGVSWKSAIADDDWKRAGSASEAVNAWVKGAPSPVTDAEPVAVAA